jgi:hypothetical protein
MIVQNDSEKRKCMPLDADAESRLEVMLMQHNGYLHVSLSLEP